MKSVYIYSNGCSSNMLDGERMCQYFELNGYELTPDPHSADLIIVNTCAFEADSERDSIDKIIELKNEKSARLVVCGCLPAINKQKLDEVFGGDYFIPKNAETWSRLDQIIHAEVPISTVKDPSILSHRWKDWKLVGLYKAFKENDNCKEINGYDENAYHIRIATGCTGSCTFCAIRYARGYIKSKTIEDIVSDFREGLTKGYRSFKIWGDDVGDYGIDINTDLANLLIELLKIEGDFELEILVMNPNRFLTLYDSLLPSLMDKRIKWLNISIQSGSPRILGLMNREVSIPALTNKLVELKHRAPHLIIRAHYIVCFPTETWKDFISTLIFTYKTRIFKYIILKYDPKPNTPAAIMSHQRSNFRKNICYAIMSAWSKLGSIIFDDGNTY